MQKKNDSKSPSVSYLRNRVRPNASRDSLRERAAPATLYSRVTTSPVSETTSRLLHSKCKGVVDRAGPLPPGGRPIAGGAQNQSVCTRSNLSRPVARCAARVQRANTHAQAEFPCNRLCPTDAVSAAGNSRRSRPRETAVRTEPRCNALLFRISIARIRPSV